MSTSCGNRSVLYVDFAGYFIDQNHDENTEVLEKIPGICTDSNLI